jgi:hypothetical protein
MAALLPVFLFLATARFSLVARLCAWMGFGLALLPIVFMIRRPDSRMNGIAMGGLALSMYNLAIFHEKRILLRWGEARISEGSIELAMLLTALAVPVMWAGWGAAGLIGLGRVLPHPRLDVPPRILTSAGVVVVVFSLFMDILFIRGDVRPVVAQLTGLLSLVTPSELGFAMILVPQLSGAAPWGGKGGGVLGVLWVGYLITGLVAGALLIVLRPLLLFVVGGLFLRRRLRLLPIVVVGSVILLAQPVKGAYRQQVWDKGGPVEMGYFQRATLYLDLMRRYWLPSEYELPLDTGESIKVAASRTGSALGLAHVIEMTPDAIPHQYGYTLRYLQVAFIPRVLYPDKPSAQVADIWYSAAYGYLYEREQSHVMVGLPQLSECYINFGFLGGLLMLMGLGALYRGVDEVIGHDAGGLGCRALYVAYATNQAINFHEGSLAQAWGGLIQYLVIYGALLAGLSRLGRRQAL